MRSRATVLCIGGALPGALLAAHGCREPTQVTLEVSTNVVCGDMRGVDIVVGPQPHAAEDRAALLANTQRFPAATTSSCEDGPAPRRIGTLVITPSASTGAVVVIAAFGKASTNDCKAPLFAPECIVARRNFSFIDHTPVNLPVLLDPSCAGVPCNENSTCVGKRCVSATVDCSNGTCTEPGAAGPVEDGASPFLDGAPDDSGLGGDGGADGATDAGTDGATGNEGGDGGGSDGGGGGDSGVVSGACPAPVKCLGTPLVMCTSAGQPLCCYTAGPTTCAAGGQCSSIAGCCRDALDCAPTEVCCASTPTKMIDTVITCRPPAQCGAGTRRVCSTPGAMGCGAGQSCAMANVYSIGPDYFGCS